MTILALLLGLSLGLILKARRQSPAAEVRRLRSLLVDAYHALDLAADILVESHDYGDDDSDMPVFVALGRLADEINSWDSEEVG